MKGRRAPAHRLGARSGLAALVCSLSLPALVCSLSLPALALPPDARLELTGKAPRIEKIDDGFTAVEVDDPKVVRAELLPSGELLLEPLAAGEAHVFLFARRLVRVVEVAVGRPLAAPAPPPAGLCALPSVTAQCYAAWRERLRRLPASEAPKLSYELEGLQAEAREAGLLLSAAGLGKLEFARSPFGVKLRGVKDDAERRTALRVVWSAVLGPLRIDG